MAYFNHAYKKTFVATKATQASSGTEKAITDGVLTEAGVHVSELKNTASPFSLGVGVVGLFDSKTHTSITSADIAAACCPFYLAGASIKLNDKQGPFHGGYQESHKSKIINPKYVRKTWKVDGNVATAAQLQIGGTPLNVGEAVLTSTLTAGGTGYPVATTVVGVATTGGTGVGATVDITTDAGGIILSIVLNSGGSGYTIADVLTITTGGADATFTADTISAIGDCNKEFICGETYYLRIEVKGTPALRFANHNLYRTLQADGGCCADPSLPVATDSGIIYKQWATQIAEDQFFKDFIRPVLVVDGISYAYNAEDAIALGLDPLTRLFTNAPVAASSAGMILTGAYVDTQFADCTFQCSDYYNVEPIQLSASEVDLNGDPCTFTGLCVVETCPGVQGNGSGEQKVRELILSESYLQNFTSSDLRIREITQGTRAYEVLDRTQIYSAFYILHSVPRFNNPSGTFDNDQYLLEIVGNPGTLVHLEAEFDAIEAAGCITCGGTEDHTAAGCVAPAIP